MCKFKKNFFFFALWGMITEAMVKLCIVQGSFRSVESSWHWDCCTLKAISLSSCPCGSTWKFSQKFFKRHTNTYNIIFSCCYHLGFVASVILHLFPPYIPRESFWLVSVENSSEHQTKKSRNIFLLFFLKIY